MTTLFINFTLKNKKLLLAEGVKKYRWNNNKYNEINNAQFFVTVLITVKPTVILPRQTHFCKHHPMRYKLDFFK